MNIEQIVSTAVAGLNLGPIFGCEDLLATIQKQRHRSIRVVELADLDSNDGICAVWLVTDHEDIVIHARSESTLHRQQFILHEFAHMILGHDHSDGCVGDDTLLQNIPPYTRIRLLRRQDLSSQTEVAAESLADHLAAGIRGSIFAESRYSKVFG